MDLQRFRGAIVGTAVGDALGAPFEGRRRVDPDAVRRWASDGATLRWTDDTAMTIGLAESLIASGGFDGPDLAARFMERFFAEPDRGYGAGPPRIFRALRDGAAWDEPAAAVFGGQGSFGNGAAMRAAPAGLYALGDPEAAADLGRRSALVTHAHEVGKQGAAVQAAAVAVLSAEPSDGAADPDLPRRLLATLRPLGPAPELQQAFAVLEEVHDETVVPAAARRDEVVARIGHGISAAEAVPAALHAALAQTGSFADAVTYAISLGGDTDTIGAMAGALAGALLGYDAIPEAWLERLEAHDDLVRLSDRLLQAATR